MAADTTLVSDLADVQANTYTKDRLTRLQTTPQTRIYHATYTAPTGDALEAGDKIRLFKLPRSIVWKHKSNFLATLVDATVLTLDVGLYEVASDGSLGTVIDADILADGVDLGSDAGDADAAFATVGYYEQATADEAWVVAEVKTATGTDAGDVVEFIIEASVSN